MVSEDSTSKVMVFPVKVLTKIYQEDISASCGEVAWRGYPGGYSPAWLRLCGVLGGCCVWKGCSGELELAMESGVESVWEEEERKLERRGLMCLGERLPPLAPMHCASLMTDCVCVQAPIHRPNLPATSTAAAYHPFATICEPVCNLGAVLVCLCSMKLSLRNCGVAVSRCRCFMRSNEGFPANGRVT